MKKIFSILAIAALMAGCSKEDSTTDVAPATFTLTGYTSNDTRTAFGEPYEANTDDWRIPFIWSDDDVIWSGSEQSSEATINPDGSASFSFASEPATTIYYNMTGSSATEANVPAAQDIANNLGENGDFGYATVENGSFTLEHATAYLGFLPILIDDSDSNSENWDIMTDATIVSITIDAADGIIAGKANWTGENFLPPTGNSKITLNINEVPDYENLIYYPVVVLPTDLSGKKIKFTYELLVDGKTKYYTVERDGKQLHGGVTYEIVDDIVLSKLTDYRELRVLTFEDEDKKFSQYNIGSYTINTWSDLIVGENEQAYMGSTLIYGSEYWWEDTDNTGLYHKFPFNYDTYAIMGGGYAISCHTGTLDDLSAAFDIYEYQLSIPCTSGHSGKNFAVGFHDSAVEYNETILPSLEFKDKIARVVDHMWVTNSSVTLYSMTYGNFVADAYKEGDFLNIVATGYNGATKTGEVRFELAKDADKKITEWTKWDLSSLGKVTKIIFRMEENTEGLTYGTWYDTPMYFAFDDVAVQF